jgi:hypothetical protein
VEETIPEAKKNRRIGKTTPRLPQKEKRKLEILRAKQTKERRSKRKASKFR